MIERRGHGVDRVKADFGGGLVLAVCTYIRS